MALSYFLQTVQNKYLEKNLMIFSYGLFLQFFQMLQKNPQHVSADLMQQFRNNILNQPIKKTEFF